MLILSVVGMAMTTYVRELKEGLAALKLKDSALNAAANGIVITDVDGRIEWANQAFSRLTGFSLSEAYGHNPRELVKSGLHDQAFYQRLWDTIQSNKIWRGEIINRRKDGSFYNEDMTITPIVDEQGAITHFIAVKQDITERKLADGYEQFRSYILQLLAEGKSIPVILEAIVRGVEQLHPAMLCSILLLDRDGMHLGNCVAPSLPDFYNDAINGVEIGIGVGSCGTAAFTGKRVIVEDITTHPFWEPYAALAARAGLGACWSQPIRSSSGQVLGTFAIYHHDVHTPLASDIAIIEQSANLVSISIDRKQAEEKLRVSDLALKAISQGVLITTADQRILSVNDAFLAITGYSRAEVLGRSCHFVQGALTDQKTVKEIRQAIETVTEFSGVILNYRRDGSTFWNELVINPVLDEQGKLSNFIGITRDISERKQMEDQVQHLAFYDTLTQLPNRRLLNDRLSQSLAACRRSGCYNALIFLDLDNFKPLNDTHGHVVGDLLLIEVASRLKNCVREIDTVARFGGDEFVIMLSELSESKTESITLTSIVAEKIRTVLSEPYLLNLKSEGGAEARVEHRCTASIGVAMFSGDEVSCDDILRWADVAMYHAKEAGRNQISFYQ
jgi:diguanylate cyclase (GGDEF)-like protein/PAS domain S-box-containing protein